MKKKLLLVSVIAFAAWIPSSFADNVCPPKMVFDTPSGACVAKPSEMEKAKAQSDALHGDGFENHTAEGGILVDDTARKIGDGAKTATVDTGKAVETGAKDTGRVAAEAGGAVVGAAVVAGDAVKDGAEKAADGTAKYAEKTKAHADEMSGDDFEHGVAGTGIVIDDGARGLAHLGEKGGDLAVEAADGTINGVKIVGRDIKKGTVKLADGTEAIFVKAKDGTEGWMIKVKGGMKKFFAKVGHGLDVAAHPYAKANPVPCENAPSIAVAPAEGNSNAKASDQKLTSSKPADVSPLVSEPVPFDSAIVGATASSAQ